MGILEKLFSSRTRAKLIGLFTTRPGERFYLREVARLIQEDVSSVKRELDHLERLGFLRSEASGNRRYIQADTRFSLFPELKRLVLKTSGLGDTLRESLDKLRGIRFAFIYGSVAKGSERPASDVDLFIVGRVPGPTLHKALARAKIALHREINTSRFDLSELKSRLKRGDSFLKTVVQDKKIFIIGTENEFERTIGGRAA
ncbi:MAG: nucleotidyltransferase domain-containing protein [Elusimicrobiota bacterium]